MNAGYVATVLLITVGMLLSATPLRHPRALGIISWLFSDLVNESPSLGLGYLLASTVPALLGAGLDPGVAIWFGIGCAGFALSPILLRRSARARPVLESALDEGLGPGWRLRAGKPRWRTHLPWFRIAVAPLPFFPAGLRVRRGQRYGAARRQRLDVYSSSARSGGRPLLIHLHGGGFRSGRKSFYARPLLHAFARHGWVCVSASYRLRPATYADMLDDAHRIITWAREHAVELGADPARIVIAGSSAGAHLALTAALTAGTEAKVAAAIGLYGYYGVVDSGGLPSQPAAHVHPDAPPVMIVHGEQDTLLPAGLQMRLVDALRRTSCSPVVYAELPGAQHTFDLLHSLRFELVVDALWAFCSWATNREDGGSPVRARSGALGPASARNGEVRSADGPHPPIHYTDIDGSAAR